MKILISDAYILGAKSIYPKSEVCSQEKEKKVLMHLNIAIDFWAYALFRQSHIFERVDALCKLRVYIGSPLIQ